MSILGILGGNLLAAGAPQNTQNTQNIPGTPSAFQQIKAEFQQLGQDLQTGNLAQAQQDYTALSQTLPGGGQNSASLALQAFNQLGQDLQSGNLQAAQKDYATFQQDTQQNAAQRAGGHHHYHPAAGSQSSSQGPNPISQIFGTLSQDLQAGNLSGAQTAFATLANDLQQIGAFFTGSNGTSAAAGATAASSLNVIA